MENAKRLDGGCWDYCVVFFFFKTVSVLTENPFFFPHGMVQIFDFFSFREENGKLSNGESKSVGSDQGGVSSGS